MYTVKDYDGNISMVQEPPAEYIYTYADYLTWPFLERLELFRGRIFKLSAPNTRHQVILGNMHAKMHTLLRKHTCKIFIAPFDVRLPVKNRKKDDEITTVVQPDLCVVCDESKLDERGCCGAPDLVVEVLSPGNSEKEVRLKFELYEEAGVTEYWIVNPEEENLIVNVLNEDGKFEGLKMYAGKDVVSSVAVQGLHVKLTDIFNQ